MNSNLKSTDTATRTGKIARLPQAVRQQLNQRLADGECGQKLVDWLNGQPAVQERLAEYYEGRPITEQNLSDWKQGGFLDWERHQETRNLLREFLCEAEELGAEAGDEMLVDRVVNMVTVVLLRLFREAATAESGPQQRQAVLEIARELSRLRRGDHQRQRVKLLAERQRIEMAGKEKVLREEEEHKRMFRLATLGAKGEAYIREYLARMAKGTLSQDRAEAIVEFFEKNQADLAEMDLKLPEPAHIIRARRRPAAKEVQSDRA